MVTVHGYYLSSGWKEDRIESMKSSDQPESTRSDFEEALKLLILQNRLQIGLKLLLDHPNIPEELKTPIRAVLDEKVSKLEGF